ncbi:cell envelope integrity protein CreD [Chitinophaga vietnamensis]|uniref:cell envelope integrity protein CreD n=1 Tax=Chitinophaga vietnamensis TaxID=2593957 RepID=UPI0011786823|nr:cell envelope integrity protein CreD [Chitinophaga vietnamensis]
MNTSFFDRYAYAVKAAIVLLLILLLLIPTGMIRSLIREREQRSKEAAAEVSGRWGGEQHITGPVLAIPYTDSNHTAWAYLLPRELKVNGELLPQEKSRGIFHIVVYDAKLQLSGSFSTDEITRLNLSPAAIHPEKAVLMMGITDLHGIDSQTQVLWNNQPYLFNPGVVSPDLFAEGMQAPVPLSLSDTGALAGNFTIELGIKGSGKIAFSPVGKSTTVNINSSWPDPSFDDATLPLSSRVDNKGFSAEWKVQYLNRNYPQSWTGKQYDIASADFGIRLMKPVDGYQQSTRAIKYAFLLIGLTFFIFYFIEQSQRRAIHPLQYALIGLALCIFYVLLISISEQLNFITAYIIASVMTIGLIAMYTASALQHKGTGIAIGVILSILYSFIYVIISAEDFGLLMGSIGLFIVLACTMYYTRRISWTKAAIHP